MRNSTDALFAGSVPEIYNRYLAPLVFEPFAEALAERARSFQPRRILETAAGTGIVTRALARELPDAEIVATDLNQAMLDVAAREAGTDRIRFQLADAQDLPFEAGSFDLVVCQFGVMFYADKVRGNAEARRVLRDGGRYIMVICDRLDRNLAPKIIHDAVAAEFPDDPPAFFARLPFGYADKKRIEDDLRAAGFAQIAIDTVERMSRPISAQEAAIGLCQGTPLRAEIEAHGPHALQRATDAAAAQLRTIERSGKLDSPLSALFVTATK